MQPASRGGALAWQRSAYAALAACAACLLLFLALGAYQLDLPGLQYDETKEAGLNAMQLVTGQPVTAFRDATVQVGPWQVPLMVQDYIGSLNVVLATPFLALGGVSPVALRWLPLLTAALTLLLAARIAWRLAGPAAAAITALLLAVDPTFVFWSRQGIFVTNLTALCFMASLLAGLSWWEGRRPRDLWMMALFWGLGIYAKLLFVWAIGAMVGVAAVALVARRLRGGAGESREADVPEAVRPAGGRSTRPLITWLVAGACFLLPLLPLILFNVRTGGTLASLFGNLGQSYYGVDNSAYWPNFLVRLNQLGVLLRGNHLWYLGEVFANNWAPWLAAGLIAAGGAAGLLRRGRRLAATLLPVGLIAFIVAQSAFTVSDLFITHDALFLPLIPLAAGMAAGTLLGRRLDPASGLPRSLAARRGAHVAAWALPLTGLLAVAGWAGVNTANTIAYHRILTRSGGYGSHSDAIYRLADYLEQWAPSAPVVLDWGMDAQLRFLSSGRVNPIEVFGYTGLDAPDAGFTGRAGPFLADPNSRFVAHAAQEEVFHGRVQALAELAARQGLELRPEAEFGLRSGKPLFIVYRAVKPGE